MCVLSTICASTYGRIHKNVSLYAKSDTEINKNGKSESEILWINDVYFNEKKTIFEVVDFTYARDIANRT